MKVCSPSNLGISRCFARGGTQRAFTVLELLVVVAILGVLAALLLPALGASRTAAHRAKCVSNLRQLGLATQMYWDENDDRAFRYKGSATNGGHIYWFGWIENWAAGSVGERKFDPALGALSPYLQGRGVELCPSLNYFGTFRMRASGATYGYGYNFYLSAPLSQPPVALSRVSNPSDTVLLADAAQVNDFDDPGSPENPLLEEFYYVDADSFGYPNAHFRHDRRANAVFCDGHVATESPVTGSLDSRMPGHWVGRLRAESLRLP